MCCLIFVNQDNYNVIPLMISSQVVRHLEEKLTAYTCIQIIVHPE